jgi:hypothetical protein
MDAAVPHLASACATMPQIDFGPYKLSRLILGANPINGGSHLSRMVNSQMRSFFTPERVLQLLDECWHEGINAWQSSLSNIDLFRRHREQGGQMHYISLGHEDPQDPQQLQRLIEAGAIAIAYHGEHVDRLFKAGQLELIKPYLQRVRDLGVLVGVSTHMPAVVDYVESKGWDVDFYMTCVYERHRTREELKALLGYVPIPLREVYLEEDPPRMWQAMRQTPRPCLAFKILAAGRLCDRQETVEQAFRETFAAIKPTDAVIVGIYPEYEDQVRLDVGYVKRFG